MSFPRNEEIGISSFFPLKKNELSTNSKKSTLSYLASWCNMIFFWKYTWLSLTLFLILFQTVSAQEIPISNKLLEELFVFEDEIVGENFEELLSEPFELNKITPEQLRDLQIFTESQIQSFLDYRKQYGPIISIYELQVIPTLKIETIKELIPHVYISNPSFQKGQPGLRESINRAENKYWSIQYERKLKNEENNFLGPPGRLLSRFRFKKNGVFSLAINAEKDAGESINWNPKESQWGFDHYGGHFSLEKMGFIKKIVAGDFLIQSGQGLVLGASFLPAKTSEPTLFIRKSHSLIKPNSSTLETGFFRGIAGILQWKNLQFTPFYSFAKKDGNLSIPSIEETQSVSTINSSGLHRTLTEIERRNNIKEQNIGLVVDFQSKNQKWQSGFTFISTGFNFPIQKTYAPHNQFDFSGQRNLTSGLFINYHWQNFLFFGE
ncbi:ComEA family DNA-binding protein, partial [Xanthovirga aplysinae]|uniref:ComEA family DNA-binding protein n=1 Tax=Xanthovirga aplysinae TaxID=2529853 RepID=UPI0016573BAE